MMRQNTGRSRERVSRVMRAVMVVSAALLMVSCAKQGTPPKAEIVFNCPANAREIAAFEKEIPAFERRTGIRVRLNPFAGDDKLYAMIAADNAPDIFYANNVVRDKLAAEGRLYDLRKLADADVWTGRIAPHAIEQGKSIDGGWYSLTNWEFTCGVYYNRELFDEMRLPYPDTAWTWEAMVRDAEALTRDRNGDGKTDQYGIFIPSHFVECFEQMNNAPIGRNSLLLSIPEESREVYRKYLDLMRRGIMPDLRRMQAMGMQAQQLLAGGRTAMLVEAVPNTNLMETMDIRWGLAPLPRFAGKEPRYFRSASGGLAVNARTKNPQAAWEVLKWIVSEASLYQPNPVLRDADFVSGWESRHPRVRGTGFDAVWDLSGRYNGGDPRYFVRFSSWTMQSIMETLQPRLDQLWAGNLSVDELAAAVPEINRRVSKELRRSLMHQEMQPAFRRQLDSAMSLLPR